MATCIHHSALLSHTSPVWTVNATNFLDNFRKRNPIAHLLGQGMICLLWVQNLKYFYLCHYCGILDHVITKLNCIFSDGWCGVFIYPYSSELLHWHWALYCHNALAQLHSFQPMAAQLSLKTALPLAKSLATVSCPSNNTGPWLTPYTYTTILH